MQFSDILYWIVFFGILTFAMKLYTKWSNAKMPKAELLSDKEVEAREKEKFPIWYHLYYPIFIIVMLGFAVGLLLLFWLLITDYPKWILSGKEYIALSTNPYGLYLLILLFFPGMIFGALLLSPLDRIFPGLVRYVEKNQLKQWGMRTRADSKTLIRQHLKLAILLSIITIPLLLLAADNYYYVDERSLHYNSFLGFGENSISLDDLERIEAGAWPNNGKNASGINWEYILVFNNGEKFNLKEAGVSDLKKLDAFLIQKNTPLKVTTLRDGALTWVHNSGSQEFKDFFNQLFTNPRNRSK